MTIEEPIEETYTENIFVFVR